MTSWMLVSNQAIGYISRRTDHHQPPLHMARPRTIPDDVLLDAALAVMAERGPTALTFAAVAGATGLATATLVQRFGSKPGLLRAALSRAWDQLDARTAAADAAAPVSVAGAVELLVSLSADYGGDAYAEGLLLLREDLRDPSLRARGHRWGAALAEALGRRLADASGPRPDLGRLMASQWQGALLWRGFEPREPAGVAAGAALRSWCAAIGRPLPE